MTEALKLTVSGTTVQGEIWATGLWFYLGVPPDDETMTDWLDAIAVLTDLGMGSGIKYGITTECAATKLRFDWHEDLLAPSTQAWERSINVEGSGTIEHPLSTAMVVSLRTGRPGASRRGRMYWPALGFTINNGRFSSTNMGSYVTEFVAMIQAWSAAYPGEQNHNYPVVASRTLNEIFPVTEIVVDDVPDVMRSRTNGLLGNKYAADYPLVP